MQNIIRDKTEYIDTSTVCAARQGNLWGNPVYSKWFGARYVLPENGTVMPKHVEVN